MEMHKMGINVNCIGEVIGTIPNLEEKDSNLVIELTKEQFERVMNSKFHSRIIFRELTEEYNSQISEFLN